MRSARASRQEGCHGAGGARRLRRCRWQGRLGSSRRQDVAVRAGGRLLRRADRAAVTVPSVPGSTPTTHAAPEDGHRPPRRLGRRGICRGPIPPAVRGIDLVALEPPSRPLPRRAVPVDLADVQPLADTGKGVLQRILCCASATGRCPSWGGQDAIHRCDAAVLVHRPGPGPSRRFHNADLGHRRHDDGLPGRPAPRRHPGNHRGGRPRVLVPRLRQGASPPARAAPTTASIGDVTLQQWRGRQHPGASAT